MRRKEEAAHRSRRRGSLLRSPQKGPVLGRRDNGTVRSCQVEAVQHAAHSPDGHLATPIDQAINAFLVDRQARGLSAGTIAFYGEKLALLQDYLKGQGIRDVCAISAQVVRGYLLDLANDHNPGGVHAAYRALRAFLKWWELETELEGWSNPLRKVRAPKLPTDLLEPVPLADLQAMVSSCDSNSFYGCRDRAILLGLLDTGCRANEFTSLSMGDVNLCTGETLVRRGKGGKPRAVFFGLLSRSALTAYLAHLPSRDRLAPLWATCQGTRLTYSGLREIIRRRARRAGVRVPSLHAFRRAFALSCLRNGMDIFALQRLMGHSNLSVLRRYLLQTTEDLRRAHAARGPVDHLLGGTEGVGA